MKLCAPAFLLLSALLSAAPAIAAGERPAIEPSLPLPACNKAVESCSVEPEAPVPTATEAGLAGRSSGMQASGRRLLELHSVRPFSAFALELKAGVAGFGLDVATPLSRRTNLRAGGSLFRYTTDVDDSGLNFDGSLHVGRAGLSLDVFPFAGSFRISPGVTLYNGNALRANAFAGGGTNFDLGDTTYTSDPSDPIHGTAVVSFGHRVAPNLTLGFGNLIPRSGAHWSFPVEFGVEFNTAPTLALQLAGSACQGSDCAPVASDADTQNSLQQEQVDFNNSVRPLRFFPIFSFGVGYRF